MREITIAVDIIRASANAAGEQANGASRDASISADGRFVAFTSEATNLVDDTNGAADVFIKDLLTGVIARASLDATSNQASAAASGASLSASGRFVAFATAAALTPADTDAAFDVYVRDLATGTLAFASVTAAGENVSGRAPSLSAEGTRVAFVGSDQSNREAVYVKDLATGSLSVLATGTLNPQTSVASRPVSLSGDGSVVAYVAIELQRVSANSFQFQETVVLKDVASGQAFATIRDPQGDRGSSDVGSLAPSLSANGAIVAYESTPFSEFQPDGEGLQSPGIVCIRDLRRSRTDILAAAGETLSARSYDPSISPDGRSLAFVSEARNLVSGDNNGVADILLTDRDTGGIARLSLSGDAIEANRASRAPSLAADGRTAAFESDASNLVAGDTNGVSDIFVSRFVSRITEMADAVFGTAFADGIQARGGDDDVYGGGGNDFVSDGSGADVVSGGDDGDAVLGDDGNDRVFGDAGDDDVRGGPGDDTVYGGSGVDVVFGEEGNDRVFGGSGDDRLVSGGTGDDVVFGEAGDDVVFGDTGRDFIGAGIGNDRAHGGEGNDEVHGESGRDALYGEAGDDGVYGKADDDFVSSGAGNDVVRRDDGNDTVFGDTAMI